MQPLIKLYATNNELFLRRENYDFFAYSFTDGRLRFSRKGEGQYLCQRLRLALPHLHSHLHPTPPPPHPHYQLTAPSVPQ
jgi:hypothetical protein